MKLNCACWFLVGMVGAVFIPKVEAQPAVALHSFAAFVNSAQTNYDGNGPVGNLLLVGTNLYGTTATGGLYTNGTLFAVSTNGAGFTNLHNFAKPLAGDAKKPNCGLVQVGNRVYGTLSEGGATDSGGVFGMNLDGTGYSNLYTFSAVALDLSIFASTNKDGAFPVAGLVAAGDMLYGVAQSGGKFGAGTIFGIRTNGTGFTNLHSFAAVSIATGTNTDGSSPCGTLILSGNTLYGTASHGGTNGSGAGTVFAVTTNGTGFVNLHNFNINVDGSLPLGGVLLADGVLYGTTSFGGPTGSGAVFKVNTNGTGFAVLHQFTARPLSPGTNVDGAASHATLILVGDTLVGTTLNGGNNATATIFTIKTNGNDFAVINHFSSNDNGSGTNTDGAYPNAGVIVADNTLYGTARNGGFNGRGSVYALPLVSLPTLAVARAGGSVSVSWPTRAVGFDLQSATNVVAPNWTNVASALAVVGTNFSYTPASGNQPATYYRLRR